jgi:hypothetical protein
VDGSDIVWQLIDFSQQLPRGDFGIRQGLHPSVGLWNKTYVRTSLKDALQELAASPTRGFDFEVTYDKLLHIYNSIGSDRSKTVVFESPGNILSYDVAEDATALANEVIGIGRGNGTQSQTVYTEGSEASQLSVGLRQQFLLRSSTDDADGTLTDQVKAELGAHGFPVEIPAITVDGNKAPYITDYGIGDRVRVRILNSDVLRHIDGSYRVERYTLDVDANDNERVTLELSI